MTTSTNWLVRLAYFAYGADPGILNLCPSHEQRRIAIMGSVVLIPALLAIFSGRIAAMLMGASSRTAVLCGLGYACLIFILDRAIVALSPQGQLTFPILMRGLLAAVLAALIAEPIVIGVFRDEINQHEEDKKSAIVQKIEKAFDTQKAVLQGELAACDLETKQLQHIYQEEYKGISGSGQMGKGPLAEEDLRLLNGQKAVCDQMHRHHEGAMQTLDSLCQVEINRQTGAMALSLTGKISTLHEIMGEKTIIAWFVWLLRLALFLAEILPLLLKLQQPPHNQPDLYHELVALRSREHWQLTNKLSETRQLIDHRAGQNMLLEQRDSLETRMLHRVAENRRIQIAFILERQRSMQRLRNEALYQYNILETDRNKQAIYRQFVARLSEDYERKLSQLYQRFAMEEMPE